MNPFLVAALCSILLPLAALSQSTLDFAHPERPHVMLKNSFALPSQLDQFFPIKPKRGAQALLTVLLEFPNLRHAADHSGTYYEDLIYGPDPSINGYFKETSYRQFEFRNAGVVGWYTAPREDTYYFSTLPNDPYTTLAAEAVEAAARAGVSFRQFDVNGDNKVTMDELLVLIVVAGDHASYNRPYVMATRFVQQESRGVRTPDGIEIDTQGVRVDEFFGTLRSRRQFIGFYAHELAHGALQLPDLYGDTFGEDPSGMFSLMAISGNTWIPHLDPWAKIHLGWIKPVVVTQSGLYTVKAVESNPEAYILYNPSRGTNEYFIVENRWPRASRYEYDASEIGDYMDRGLAVWHITELYDNTPFDFLRGRKTIGMKWAQGPRSLDTLPFRALWDGSDPLTAHDFTPGSTPRNSNWADGSASGIQIAGVSAAGPEMQAHFWVADRPVTGSPVAAIAPALLTFTAALGAPPPPAQRLLVTNSGGGTLDWFVSASASWLSVRRNLAGRETTGSEGPGQTSSPPLEVQVDLTGLAPGTYNTTILVTSNGGTSRIPVRLELSPATPGISANGVVNGASFQPGIVPNSWATIRGTNLATVTTTWENSIVNGRLPTTLGGVSVRIGGQPAYVYYVSPSQINLIVPNVGPGPMQVVVTNSAGTSAAFTTLSNQYGPAFFPWPGNQAVATRQDFSFAAKDGTFAGAATVPAKPGDVIILWATGFGPTAPASPAGVQVPGDRTYLTTTLPVVTINNVPVTVFGAALAPGYAGLYQVAIQVPVSIADGDWPVEASIGGMQSPSGTVLSVRK